MKFEMFPVYVFAVSMHKKINKRQHFCTKSEPHQSQNTNGEDVVTRAINAQQYSTPGFLIQKIILPIYNSG